MKPPLNLCLISTEPPLNLNTTSTRPPLDLHLNSTQPPHNLHSTSPQLPHDLVLPLTTVWIAHLCSCKPWLAYMYVCRCLWCSRLLQDGYIYKPVCCTYCVGWSVLCTLLFDMHCVLCRLCNAPLCAFGCRCTYSGCTKAFSVEYNLKKHVKSHESKPYKVCTFASVR